MNMNDIASLPESYYLSFGLAIGSLVVTLAIIILMIVSWWFIYDKMGEKGWKCLIPFYGRYTLFSCVWEGKVYWISLVLSALSFVMSVYGAVVLMFGFMSAFLEPFIDVALVTAYLPTSGGVGIMLFASIFSFAAFIVQMILNWRMVKCFGYGIGFFLGITLFPLIFIPILAFGNAYFDYY